MKEHSINSQNPLVLFNSSNVLSHQNSVSQKSDQTPKLHPEKLVTPTNIKKFHNLNISIQTSKVNAQKSFKLSKEAGYHSPQNKSHKNGSNLNEKWKAKQKKNIPFSDRKKNSNIQPKNNKISVIENITGIGNSFSPYHSFVDNLQNAFQNHKKNSKSFLKQNHKYNSLSPTQKKIGNFSSDANLNSLFSNNFFNCQDSNKVLKKIVHPFREADPNLIGGFLHHELKGIAINESTKSKKKEGAINLLQQGEEHLVSSTGRTSTRNTSAIRLFQCIEYLSSFSNDLNKQFHLLAREENILQNNSMGSLQSISDLNKKIDAFTEGPLSTSPKSNLNFQANDFNLKNIDLSEKIINLVCNILSSIKNLYNESLRQELKKKFDSTYDFQNDSTMGELYENQINYSLKSVKKPSLKLRLDLLKDNLIETKKEEEEGKQKPYDDSKFSLIEENQKLKAEMELLSEKEYFFEKLLNYLEFKKGYNLENLFSKVLKFNQA